MSTEYFLVVIHFIYFLDYNSTVAALFLHAQGNGASFDIVQFVVLIVLVVDAHE